MKPDSSRVFHVRPEQNKQTVLALLRQCLPGESWTGVRDLLKKRRIMVNGNLCLDEGRRVKEGDVVKLTDQPQLRPPRESDLKIQYLDDDIVIVEKPAGITTLRHAEERTWPDRRKQLQPTLDEVLTRLVAQQTGQRGKSKKGQPPRVRAVHRLDRDTSGLMVFARTVPAEQHLVQQFAQHTIDRMYLAVVHGSPSKQKIESYLVRDRGDGLRGSQPDPETGKRAVTYVVPKERLGDYSLIECRLETGRTHQIRIHLSEAGHRLCGEKMYVKPLGGKLVPDDSRAPRVALHAAELGLHHPSTGEPLHFRTGFPPDLADFVARLRKAKKAPHSSKK